MRPATAAEALRGLIQVRPRGWLAHPQPLDPAVAADLLNTVRNRDHPQAGGPVRVLAARATATVATLGAPPRAVLKVHADSGAYDLEALAYALAGHCPALPRLLEASDASRSLLLEYLPHSFDWTSAHAHAEVTAAVAAVHAAPAGLDPVTAAVFDPFRLGRLAAGPAPDWITDPDAWHTVMTLCLRAYGPPAIPLGHLDLKPEHVRRRADGTPVLVDVETVRPDITGLVDLITLPAVLRQAGRPLPARTVRDLYRDAAARHNIRWTAADLRDALIAYQRATGLDTLHGLAD